MLKCFRIVLWALLTKRESEVIMRLGKVRFKTDRLFEFNLRRCEILAAHKIDALVVKFESRTANLLSQQVALNCGTATTATSATSATTTSSTCSAPRAHCSDCPNTDYTNTEIEPPLWGIKRPVTRKGQTSCC